MKTAAFNNFRDYVTKADDKDPIWWAGYMWIDLTGKQCRTMYEILKLKGMERGDKVVMPSGLSLTR